VTAYLEVVRAGALTTIQDLGRPGYAHLAVPRSGALDQPAMRLANRLVGNREDAAVLETTVDGVAVRASHQCHVAVTGADAAIRVGGTRAGWSMPLRLDAGSVLDVGLARSGLRSYVAVSGGIAVTPVLGSRSSDLLSGTGPPIVRDSAVLPVGPDRFVAPPMDYAPYPRPSRDLSLDCYLGPRADWLSADAVELLGSTTWTVSSQSNRIALRLQGPPLQRVTLAELPSEGAVLGSIQIPADGQPVLFLADHPATGGYPVIAVVGVPDIWMCGQAAPDTRIRLRLKHQPPL
jgi:biotin-dependent carboxylase-like uncharacterized protein